MPLVYFYVTTMLTLRQVLISMDVKSCDRLVWMLLDPMTGNLFTCGYPDTLLLRNILLTDITETSVYLQGHRQSRRRRCDLQRSS